MNHPDKYEFTSMMAFAEHLEEHGLDHKTAWTSDRDKLHELHVQFHNEEELNKLRNRIKQAVTLLKEHVDHTSYAKNVKNRYVEDAIAILSEEKVMCCLCFNRFDKNELSTDPKTGLIRDVCKECDKLEQILEKIKQENQNV